MLEIDWSKPHIYKIGNDIECLDEIEEKNTQDLRDKIEPWLTAVFQSDHLSLLTGNGLTTAISGIAGADTISMSRIKFDEYGDEISKAADEQAATMVRGKANIEDDLRVAIELYKGLLIQNDKKAKSLKTVIDEKIYAFIKTVLNTERDVRDKDNERTALAYLKSFLVSFASRTVSRDRLNIFTTNYDRFLEYACDKAGILILDKFVGKISPEFRTSKLEIDYHYNPPGIRGEPRYVEGVVKYTKLHGSLDWRFKKGYIVKTSLPFAAEDNYPELPEEPFDHVVIYPNSSKGIETAFYPYSELFRDFSSAICRPNTSVITYGYGFGDSHINRILEDMLTIPSTHLVIISWDDAEGRIEKFIGNNLSQYTLLIGNHFGGLKTLVDNYLPKAAIDTITAREHAYREKTGKDKQGEIPKKEIPKKEIPKKEIPKKEIES